MIIRPKSQRQNLRLFFSAPVFRAGWLPCCRFSQSESAPHWRGSGIPSRPRQYSDRLQKMKLYQKHRSHHPVRIASREMLLWGVSLHQEKCYFPIGKKTSRRSNMMSLKSKRELIEVVQSRYLKASKFEKQKMLDEFTFATGYHRKHAVRVLKNQV